MARDKLLRTKTDYTDDDDWAGDVSLTVPVADQDPGRLREHGLNGPVTQIEIVVVATDGTDQVDPAAGSFDLQLVRLFSRADGSVAKAGSDTLTSQAFGTMIRVPFNGGDFTVRLSNLTAPAGGTQVEIWYRLVSE